MSREAFETLPLWKAAMRLATDAHRVAANFPADEKSGLGGTLKKLADAPAILAAHADAAESPDDALTQLTKCESTVRELLATALLAHRLDILSKSELRRFRLHVARLRRLVAEETQAWELAADEMRRDAEAAEAQPSDNPEPSDHDFDPRDYRRIEEELDLDDVDAIGLAAPPHRPPLRWTGTPHRPNRKPAGVLAKWFGLRNAA